MQRSRPVAVSALAALLCGSSLIACGGGSVNTTPVPSPAPSASATATPPAGATSVAVPTTASTLTLPAVNGQSATLSFAAGAPAGVTLSAVATTTAPSNAPLPSFVRRTASVAGAIPFYYVYLTVSATLSLQYVTSESVPTSSAAPNAAYYAEYDDVTTTPALKLMSDGPSTQSSTFQTIQNSFIGEASIPSLVPGHTYLLQFYYVPAAATPTPAPTPVATATTGSTPTPAPTTTPTIPPTPASTSAAIPITLPAQDFVTVAFPAASLPSNIASGSIEFFETGNAAANVTVTLANAPPPGYPPLLPVTSTSVYAPILTLTYTTNTAIAAFTEPIVTFTDASTTQQPTILGYNIYCGEYSVAGSAWQSASGAAEISGTFTTSPTSLPITLQPAQTFVYALFYDNASNGGTPTCN